MQYLFHPVCTLLKRELLYIPLWGWAMSLLRPIAINRSKPKEAILQTLDEGSKRLKNKELFFRYVFLRVYLFVLCIPSYLI